MDPFDREAELLEEDHANGGISTAEFNHNMRELERDRNAAAEEAAQDAYDNVFGRW